MNAEPDPVVCLSCGELRASPTSQPECPVCDYVGWAYWSSLPERERLWYSAISAEREGSLDHADPLVGPPSSRVGERRAEDESLHDLERIRERRGLATRRDRRPRSA
jgi:hypothetical protein